MPRPPAARGARLRPRPLPPRRAHHRTRRRRRRQNPRRPPPAARSRRNSPHIRRRGFRTPPPTTIRARARPSNDGRRPSGTRLAEHHVVGARFAREHGIVAGGEPAAAGDALGLERRERGAEIVDAGEMRAVGARTRHHLRMAVDDQRRAPCPAPRARAPSPSLIIVRSSTPARRHQHGRHIGRRQRGGEVAASRAGSDTRRDHQIEARGRALLLRRVLLGTPWQIDCPRNRAVWGHL